MKKNEIVKYGDRIKNLLDIKSLGFVSTDYYGSSNLLRNVNDIQNKIHFDLFNSRNNSLNINILNYSIVSPFVNKILEIVSAKVYLNQMSVDDILSSSHEHTIYCRPSLQAGEEMDIIHKITFVENGIFYEERMVELAERFKKHIEKYIQPFFDSLTSLQEINDKIIDKYPENEWANYFFGHTNLKVIIIMKLCDSPRYHSFTKMLRERIMEALFNQGKTEYQDYYNVFTTLLEYLDSEEYKQDTV